MRLKANRLSTQSSLTTSFPYSTDNYLKASYLQSLLFMVHLPLRSYLRSGPGLNNKDHSSLLPFWEEGGSIICRMKNQGPSWETPSQISQRPSAVASSSCLLLNVRSLGCERVEVDDTPALPFCLNHYPLLFMQFIKSRQQIPSALLELSSYFLAVFKVLSFLSSTSQLLFMGHSHL